MYTNEVWKYGVTTKQQEGRYREGLPEAGLYYDIQFRGTYQAQSANYSTVWQQNRPLMQRKKQYDFIVTGISWEEYTPKLIFNCAKLHSLLNTYLNLKDYGTQVQQLAFAYIVQASHHYSHEEIAEFDTKKHCLYGQFYLAPTFLVGLDETSTLSLLAKTYLLHLSDFAALNIPDFQLEDLKKDVGQVFEGAGLLRLEILQP